MPPARDAGIEESGLELRVTMVDGPLGPEIGGFSEGEAPEGAGAFFTFEGVVRPSEEGHPIVALDYEDYPPMTEHELERLAGEVGREHGVLAVRVAHSRGRVPAGRASFRLGVAAPHRKEALAAVDAFVDRLKAEIPLWKLPVGPEGERWVPEHGGRCC